MSTEQKIEVEIALKKPQVFLKSITFNDETTIMLNHNSIIVFTGANNSGKSQILRDIENTFKMSNTNVTVVVKSTQNEYCGTIDEAQFLNDRFCLDKEGKYKLLGTGNSYPKSVLQSYWKDHRLYHGLYILFVKRLCTELRLTASNALIRNIEPEKHPIFKLNKSESLAEKISGYFHQAFDVDLIVNRNEMECVPLHVGQAPDKKSFTIDRQDAYYDLVADLPKLEDQGDGMRSFASILLDTFTSNIALL